MVLWDTASDAANGMLMFSLQGWLWCDLGDTVDRKSFPLPFRANAPERLCRVLRHLRATL